MSTILILEKGGFHYFWGSRKNFSSNRRPAHVVYIRAASRNTIGGQVEKRRRVDGAAGKAVWSQAIAKASVSS